MSVALCREDAIVLGRCAGGRGPMLRSDELGWLYDLAEQAPDGIAVEIGIFCGGSLVCWAAARQGRGPIIGVDLKLRGGLLQTVEQTGYDIQLVTGDSWEAHKEIPGDLAFCFIDADHSIEGVTKDILPWTSRVMPGGIVVFHDYDVWKPTVAVQEYVDYWQSLVQWEDLGAVRSAKAFRRP